MKILALEFSSNHRSVAVWCEDGRCAQVSESFGRATPAFAMMERVLAEMRLDRREIDVIAVGLGPGSYTGIRAAIAIAQGWQIARGVQVAGISSVASLVEQAHQAGERGRRHFVVDAQRREFYRTIQELDGSGACEVEPLRIVPASQIEDDLAKGAAVLGPDAATSFAAARDLFPEAGAVARLAARTPHFVAGEQLEPIYLREVSFVKSPLPHGAGPL